MFRVSDHTLSFMTYRLRRETGLRSKSSRTFYTCEWQRISPSPSGSCNPDISKVSCSPSNQQPSIHISHMKNNTCLGFGVYDSSFRFLDRGAHGGAGRLRGCGGGVGSGVGFGFGVFCNCACSRSRRTAAARMRWTGSGALFLW